MEQKIIAAFDFDGTLTTKDTFVEFMKFTHSPVTFYLKAFLCIPFILAYKWKMVPNYVAKQKIFSFFYKGMKYDDFLSYGKQFAKEIDKFVRQYTLQLLQDHKNRKHKIYVISAGGIEWIEYWCKLNGVDKVIATTVETDEKGRLTGRFSSKNCYGEEKVRRFLKEEPSRSSYILYAYGDSEGDKYLLAFADYGELV